MTAKEKIRIEIERQISAIDKCPKVTDTQVAVLAGNKAVLNKRLSFIDSLSDN